MATLLVLSFCSCVHAEVNTGLGTAESTAVITGEIADVRVILSVAIKVSVCADVRAGIIAVVGVTVGESSRADLRLFVNCRVILGVGGVWRCLWPYV